MSAVITSPYVMVHPDELQRLQADLAAATQQVEDIEGLLAADPCLPHKTQLGLRLQERLGQLELRLAAVTKERDAMLPDWMRLRSWLPKHWHIAKDVSGEVQP
jgi:hypothetical protein